MTPVAGDGMAIELRGIVKRYGAVTALGGATLSIRDNEFLTLLGPSGCGKTTLLRVIAGFEEVTEGEIRLYGEDIGNLPPHRRPINTVFQHYALFPHMTVAENVAVGMRMLGIPAAEIEAQTLRMLELVKLADFASPRPAQLSGGQQQRVALARAMAPRPKVPLLDEPLSALDLKLRQSMRMERKQLQQETGITFVFVTPDQEEALTMSERIAVMSVGSIRQVGTPLEIYEAPVDRFVTIFARSIAQAGVATVLCLGIGFPTACYIATRPPAARPAWLFLVTVPYWVNLLIRTVSMKFLIREQGPLNEALLGLGVISESFALVNTNLAVQLGLFYSAGRRYAEELDGPEDTGDSLPFRRELTELADH